MARAVIEALDFRLDEASRELFHRGRRVRLAEKPFRVLVALVAARGDVVTRAALKELLWSEDTFVDFDNNLNSAVASLRHALGDSARRPSYIETIPRVGYRLLMTAPTSKRSSRRALYAALTIAVASTVALGIAVSRDDGPRRAHAIAQPVFERARYLQGQFFAT